MELRNKIILLNGLSSAGKSSLVKAIQHLDEELWLTFGIDTALDTMPNKYIGMGEKAAQGFLKLYDLEIDTTNTNSFTNAQKVLKFIKENKKYY